MENNVLLNLDLDTLIAKEIMKWVHVHNDDSRDDDTPTFMVYHNKKVLKGEPYKIGKSDKFYAHTFREWSPTSKIQDAFEVVNRMNVQYGLGLSLTQFTETTCAAVFSQFDAYATLKDGKDEAYATAMLAICHAALKIYKPVSKEVGSGKV